MFSFVIVTSYGERNERRICMKYALSFYAEFLRIRRERLCQYSFYVTNLKTKLNIVAVIRSQILRLLVIWIYSIILSTHVAAS